MSDSAVDEVLSLLARDDNLPRLAELLCGLTDKQRKALSGPVGKRAEGLFLNKEGSQAHALAVLGCVTGVRQVASRLEWISFEPEAEALAVEVLKARQPHWLPSLSEALLVGRERSPQSFRLVRALVRSELIDYPSFPEYVLSIVRGLVGRHGWLDGPTVLDCLRIDVGLVDREVWELFATEGAGKLLASHDSWLLKPFEQRFGNQQTIPARPQRTWQHAVLTLVDDGTIDRSRLIDATLAAFFRDWTAGDVSWFVKLHDTLQPSIDELGARQKAYARLLAVEPGPPVNLGLRSMRALLAAGELDADVLVTNTPAVFSRRDKGSVTDGLKLLEQASKARPELREQIAGVAAQALSHERVDVQERALTLLTKLVPEGERRDELISTHAESLAPSVRQSGPPIELASPTSVERDAEPLVPVADADELAELLARLVEEADDPAEVERLVEGTARLARNRPAHGADALAKRLHTLERSYFPGPWYGQELRADLVALGLVWLERRRPSKGFPGRHYDTDYQRGPGVARATPLIRPDWSMTALVTMRIHEVALAVADGGAALLSFPSRRDGVLNARDLNARVADSGRLTKPLPLDAGLAILRVPPDEYGELRLSAAHRTAKLLGDQLNLIRSHLPAWKLVVGDSTGLYRSDIYKGAITWRDKNAPEGAINNMVAAVLDRRDPLKNLALEASDGEYASRFDQVTAVWPLMLPHHVDLLAAHAHPRLNRALTKNRSGTEPLLDAIGAAIPPLGPPTVSALVLGLAAKNGVERTRAVDAIVDLSARGALDGAFLGTQVAELLGTDGVVGSRVAAGLTDAARADPAASPVVLDCLTVMHAALAGRRDAHQFIDLLAQLAISQGRTVALAEPFAALAASRQSSLLAKACRRVPQPSEG